MTRLDDLRAGFKDAARGRPCAVCGSRLFVEAHHVVYRQVARRIAQGARMDVAAIEWDRRNVLPVCNLCHQRHHSGAARIALSVIVEESPTALLFAAELGPEAVAHIHRNYQPTGE